MKAKRCQALIDAGIINPESKEGIKFCVNKCPYEFCVVMEQAKVANRMKLKGMEDFAKACYRAGVSQEDIGLILGRGKYTIRKYISECLAEENQKTRTMRS